MQILIPSQEHTLRASLKSQWYYYWQNDHRPRCLSCAKGIKTAREECDFFRAFLLVFKLLRD